MDCAHDSVSRWRVLGEEEVSALLTAESCSGAAKLLSDMSIADLCSYK